MQVIKVHQTLSQKGFLVLFLIIVQGFSLLYIPSPAQDPKAGKLNLHQDDRISLLVQKHIQLNKNASAVLEGYRVQIFFDSGNESKKRAIDARSDFAARFPDCPAYLTFQEPFYKVRVGDFRTRVEADGFLEKVQPDYPNAFTVKDKINYPKVD